MGLRSYDPLLGRFLSPERGSAWAESPILGQYTYASNSPPNLIDPSGEAPASPNVRWLGTLFDELFGPDLDCGYAEDCVVVGDGPVTSPPGRYNPGGRLIAEIFANAAVHMGTFILQLEAEGFRQGAPDLAQNATAAYTALTPFPETADKHPVAEVGAGVL
jgi:hypothetical protein